MKYMDAFTVTPFYTDVTCSEEVCALIGDAHYYVLILKFRCFTLLHNLVTAKRWHTEINLKNVWTSSSSVSNSQLVLTISLHCSWCRIKPRCYSCLDRKVDFAFYSNLILKNLRTRMTTYDGQITHIFVFAIAVWEEVAKNSKPNSHLIRINCEIHKCKHLKPDTEFPFVSNLKNVYKSRNCYTVTLFFHLKSTGSVYLCVCVCGVASECQMKVVGY